jgi:hypothetical protein
VVSVHGNKDAVFHFYLIWFKPVFNRTTDPAEFKKRDLVWNAVPNCSDYQPTEKKWRLPCTTMQTISAKINV